LAQGSDEKGARRLGECGLPLVVERARGPRASHHQGGRLRHILSMDGNRCWCDLLDRIAWAASHLCGEEGKERNPARRLTRRGSIIDMGEDSLTVGAWPASGRMQRQRQVEKSLRLAVARSADPKAVAREAVVLVLVGLPARGKSYLSGAVVRHLRLLGVRVRNFNAGELRRDTGKAGIGADFFSAKNADAKRERERLAMQCLDALLEWIRQSPPGTSSVGILDATNTTVERRRTVLAHCRAAVRMAKAAEAASFNDDQEQPDIRVVFLESICDDPKLLQGNYRMKLVNDDYKAAADPNAALADFRARVAAYEQQYEPLQNEELEPPAEDADVPMPVGWIRIFNGGDKIACCRTGSSLVAEPVVSLLHAMHLTPRRILLAPEAVGLGSDMEDAQALAALLRNAEEKEEQSVDVICGASQRGAELAQLLARFVPALGSAQMLETQVDHWEPAGMWAASDDSAADGPKKVKQPRRAILTLRALNTRYMNSAGEGLANEGYADLVRRMRSEVILLIERLPRSVLVVCPGEDVRRVLLAHFKGCDSLSLADLNVPAGKAIELERDHKGFSAKAIDLPAPEGNRRFR